MNLVEFTLRKKRAELLRKWTKETNKKKAIKLKSQIERVQDHLIRTSLRPQSLRRLK